MKCLLSKSLLVLLLLGACSPVHAQLLTWLNFATHNGNSNVVVKDIGGDFAGNTFFLIQFTGTVNIGSTTYSSPQNLDYLIVKRDVNENLVWTRRVYCSNNFGCRSICADSSGNVYVVGCFNGYDTLSFDAGSSGLHTLPVFTVQTGYVAKFDQSGNFQWVKTIEGQASPTGQTSVDLNYVRLNGNCLFITGLVYSIYDFDPSASVSTVGFSGNSPATAIALFDLNGNMIWAKPFGSFGAYINYMCFTGTKDILIAGNLTGTSVDLNPGPASTSFNSVGPSDIFVTCLDSMGIYRWTRRITGNNTQEIGGIDMFSDTSFVVCGITNATIDIDPTGDTCSIVCISQDVDFLALYGMSSAFISGGSVNTGLSPEHIFCNGFHEVILFGGAFAGHYGMVFTDTSYQTWGYNSFGGNSPGASASSHYFRYPFTLYVGGNAGGSNNYGNNGIINVSAACSPFTGFTAKYYLGWGPQSVSDLAHENRIKVYPNPADESATLLLPDEHSSLYVYAMDGTLVLSETNIVSGQFTLNTSALPSGIYLVKCEGSEASAMTKLMIAR